jgi:formin 2/WAS/WASL-interacting protein
MGFMDKAKKMAEQAQAKLDEAQKQFNSGQAQGQGSGPAVEYDKHGRPIPQDAAATAAPPHGDPLAGNQAPPPPPEAPAPPTPPVAAAPAPPAPTAPPAQPAADAPAEDRNNPSYAPPKLSSGDPLAG